jgi:YVTN family beta-propeller protein
VTVEAGRQPAGMTFTPDGKTLYAASSDDDTVLAVDVAAHRISRIMPLNPRADAGFFGQIPTSVAVTADNKMLFVACGGANSVAVIDTKSAQVTGYIPRVWVPVQSARRKAASPLTEQTRQSDWYSLFRRRRGRISWVSAKKSLKTTGGI